MGLAFKRLNSITHHTSLTKSAQWISVIFFRGNLDIGWSQMQCACIWFSFHCSRFLRRTYLQSSETLARLKRLIKMKADFIWVLSWFLDWGILCLIFEIAKIFLAQNRSFLIEMLIHKDSFFLLGSTVTILLKYCKKFKKCFVWKKRNECVYPENEIFVNIEIMLTVHFVLTLFRFCSVTSNLIFIRQIAR